MLPLAIFLFVGVLVQQTFADEPEAIVGGTTAAPGEFPYQVSLNVNNKHMCGGSIVNNYTILTAAHCVRGIVYPPYKNFYILSGTNDNTKGGQVHRVKKVRAHPGYIDNVDYSWVNDVAVIILAEPIKYNKYQSPIELADSQPTPDTVCTLSGWGQTTVSGGSPKYLLKMTQSVVSLSQCQKRHHDMPLTNSHLCAYNRRGIGACSGDSGGPLVANGKQVGLASWVFSCAAGKPDVYTNVYHHRKFILGECMLPFAIFLFVGVLAQQTFADEPEAIVGGTQAAPGEFPWQCSLQQSGSHFCGGSIIAPTKVLTAAHCVESFRSPSSFRVVTGSTDSRGGITHVVQRFVIHPGYTGQQRDSWRNDVAVITLAAPIQYNQYQQPIALATSQPLSGTSATLSGWGLTSTNGNLSRYLLKMDQSVVSISNCQQRHRGMPLDNSHLCALNRRGIGACQGDSGGPLVANRQQIGVTSWVLPCAQGEPDAYANVPSLRPWILSQTFADEPEAIVGGTPAALGEFPWQCSLNLNGGHICGCSIIGPTKILTAAHCVRGLVKPPYNNFLVRTGSIDSNTGTNFRVQKVVEHPQYSDNHKDAMRNDIAVITIASPIQYNQYQKPIALADSPPAPGTLVTLSGWGLTNVNGRPARYLQKMNQSIISLSNCQNSHRGVPFTSTHLCAYNRFGIGACMGDSGGPLVANGKQVGVVSWGSPCAVGAPDVYTNVYHHLSFIASS
ncbi:transmembrane protease serine 9-like [Nylanderia fulva]|uniref:transmembrane protease serine 9-like n=1 Tax=Nylanderia fulva TaxID=613905 RepID=UPI0010FB1B9E|nr:transmembrane protease serine 9-like [Nylanderia fulva]